MPSRSNPNRRSQTTVIFALAGAAALSAATARADLTFLNVIGGVGTGTGQFEEELSCALAPNGNLYVSDRNNQRVQVFSPTGAFLTAFGSAGAGGGQFTSPFGVAIGPNGNTYVVDNGNNRVEIFNSANLFVGSFGALGSANGQFDNPFGVAVNAAGNVYVADQGNRRVEVFNASGTFLSAFGSGGSGNGQFGDPSNLCLDSSGNVYVTDFGNGRVEIFNSAGVFQSAFGSLGSGNGQFNGPNGISVSSNGLIYVADSVDDRVSIFTAGGLFESSFGALGTGNGQFDFPTGVAVAPNGLVYVVDDANNRIQRLFDPNAWVTGANTFTDPTVGPTTVGVGTGQLLGGAFSLNSGMTLNATTLNPIAGGTFTQNGGGISLAVLSLSGTFNYQSGSFTCGSITLTGNGIFNAIHGGILTANSLTTSGAGSEVDLDGGTSLSVPSGVTLGGGILVIGQATLSTNTLTNSSASELQLGNANQSIVQGNLANSGLIDGSGRIVGTLQNNATGQIAVSGLQNLTITGSGNTNAGTLQLTGGTLHFTQDLTSSGSILGTGTLRVDGGLTNTGMLGLAGNAFVFANLTSSAAGTIHLSGNTPNIFYGPVANAGPLNVDAGAIGIFYGAYTGSGPISDNGSLFINANSIAGTISGNGSLTINGGTLALAGAAELSSLAIAGSGGTFTSALDLTSNKLILNASSASDKQSKIAFLNSAITSGFNNAIGGGWTGNGVTSSTAAADPAHYAVGLFDNAILKKTSFGGQPVNSNSLLATIAHLGDANDDGVVDLQDLAIITNHWQSNQNTWTTGDLNRDGIVDLGDLSVVTNNWQQTSSFSQDASPLNLSPQSSSLITSSVPEPASLTLLTLALPFALKRKGKGRTRG